MLAHVVQERIMKIATEKVNRRLHNNHELMKNVIIYSTPTCSYCHAAKAFFRENNIEYKEIDVASDQSAGQEMIAKSGQMGVPVIIIEDEGKEEIIVGFDQPRLSKLLEIGN